jgi:hypothetical protein
MWSRHLCQRRRKLFTSKCSIAHYLAHNSIPRHTQANLQLIAPRLLLVLIDAEAVAGLEDVGTISRAEDLLLLAAPGGVVDAVNVVLDLEDNAAVLGDDAGEVLVVLDALGLLEGEGAVLLGAAVDLEGVLVGEDVDADAGPGGGEGGDGAEGAPVEGAVGVAVDDEAVVCEC